MDAAVPERGSAVVWTDADFDRHFSRLRGRLVAVCAGLVGPAEAEDVVHDAYLRARRSVAELRDADAFDAWLTRIAINLCYTRHQRARTLRGLLPSLLPSPTAHSRDFALRDLIERLPARERTILVLHYGHGYRLDEIAELLSLTAVNVRAIVSRTRRRLADEWRRAADD